MSSFDLLEMTAGSGDAHRPVLVSGASSWTFEQLSRSVDVRAEQLSREGAVAGSVFPLVLESDAAGVTSLLACWRLGATPAPLNPGLSDEELSVAGDALTGATSGAQAVLWTSGTSGRPRGVAISADNLLASCEAVRKRLELSDSDCWLASLSVAHVGGLVLVVRALLTGATLVATGGFRVDRVSALLEGSAGAAPPAPPITHLSLVPTQLLRLLDHRDGRPPPDTLRCVLIGGAETPPRLLARALEAGWPVALTYGMTEMTSQVATAPPQQVRAKPGTVGKALPGVEVELDPTGQILTRGATRALGYVGGGLDDIVDDEGWYHTGDHGRLDEDGDLWITGRRADRIVSGGMTVDAQEVESALRGCPGVADVCVVGIPSAEWGEVVAAAVVAGGDGVDLIELETRASAELGPAKRPRLWRATASLPRNVNGKVDRAAVRALLEEV